MVYVCDPFAHTVVKDIDEQSPLDIALEDLYDAVYIDLAIYLINLGCGNEKDKEKLLCGACWHGKLDAVKELVEGHGCDPKG